MPPLLRIAVLTLGVALATAAAAAAADEPADPVSALRINGFGTLGVTRMSDTPGWGFRRDGTQPLNDGGLRGDIDSRIGLQGNYAVNPRLELVGQVLLRRRTGSSTPEDSLEWAFASWHATADTTVRIGRTAPDLFLLSDHRNVGFAYPWVRPNVEVYALLPIFSINSVDLEQVWDRDDVRWRTRLFGGNGEIRIPGGPTDDYYFTLRSIHGGVVSRESGGMTLRATVTRVEGDLRVPPVSQVDAGLAQLQTLPVPEVAAEAAVLRSLLSYGNGHINYFALGAAYDNGPWLVNAEYIRLDSSLALVSAQSAYVGVARRVGEVSIFGMVGAARSSAAVPAVPQWQARLTPVIGAAQAGQAQALGSAAAAIGNVRVHQRSLSFGARWDVQPQVALKLQVDHFRVEANGGGIWGDRNSNAVSPNVVSATADFIF